LNLAQGLGDRAPLGERVLGGVAEFGEHVQPEHCGRALERVQQGGAIGGGGHQLFHHSVALLHELEQPRAVAREPLADRELLPLGRLLASMLRGRRFVADPPRHVERDQALLDVIEQTGASLVEQGVLVYHASELRKLLAVRGVATRDVPRWRSAPEGERARK
jgi:hypothetical protein